MLAGRYKVQVATVPDGEWQAWDSVSGLPNISDIEVNGTNASMHTCTNARTHMHARVHPHARMHTCVHAHRWKTQRM